MQAQLTPDPLLADQIVNDTSTIFVVEDNPSLRALLCSVLSEEHPHFHICGSATGEQALTLATQTRPRLLLLDYHLAGNMNGIELYDAFCGQGESISTIMISGDAPPADLQLRHIPNLGKPFDLEILLERVGRELSPAQAAGVFSPAD